MVLIRTRVTTNPRSLFLGLVGPGPDSPSVGTEKKLGKDDLVCETWK